DPERAPDSETRSEIEAMRKSVREFARRVHTGEIAPQRGGRFRNLLSVGIGGSALGPQLFADALASPDQQMRLWFLDNTDPDGIARVFAEIGSGLAETLTVVISKSGRT